MFKKIVSVESRGERTRIRTEEKNKNMEELKDGPSQKDLKVRESEQASKYVMSQVVGIAEKVAQAVEAITEEVKEQEGEEPPGVDLSFPETS